MVTPPNGTIVPKFLAASLISIGLAACATVQTNQPGAETASVRTTAPSSGPAIWSISDEDTTIHLFGFAPVLETGTEWQTETILTALDTSDLFIIESDNRSDQAQATMQALIPQIGLNRDGSTLSSKLTDQERAEVDAISTTLGAPLAALNPLKPWLASVQIGVLAVSNGEFDLVNTPAAQLSDRASAAGMTIRALEGPTDLMQIMAEFPSDLQVGMLLHTARTIRDKPGQQSEIANAWLAGDVELIGELLHGEQGAWSSVAIYNAMLVTRNQAWVNEVKSLMAEHEGAIFFSVGLGHFAGDDSLVGMLEAEGFDVVRR